MTCLPEGELVSHGDEEAGQVQSLEKDGGLCESMCCLHLHHHTLCWKHHLATETFRPLGQSGSGKWSPVSRYGMPYLSSISSRYFHKGVEANLSFGNLKGRGGSVINQFQIPRGGGHLRSNEGECPSPHLLNETLLRVENLMFCAQLGGNFCGYFFFFFFCR